jgi:hypothetical protein
VCEFQHKLSYAPTDMDIKTAANPMLPVQIFFHCSYVQEIRFTMGGKKRLG